MLDRISKKLLTLAISKYPGNMETPIEIYASEIGIDYTELNAAIRFLKEYGFLSRIACTPSAGISADVYLTHKGLHYFGLKRALNRDVLKKSVFLPIVVTLLTQLSTPLLKALSLHILQWLTRILSKIVS